MSDAKSFIDDLGPAKIIQIYEPGLSLRAVLVVDNVAAGPAIGGVRMAADVTTEECFRLARAMTLKNAAAGLPHGGGKSVIVADPKQDPERKEQLVRAFARAIEPITDYIPGPDMGTNETAMAWVRDEIGRAVGLPPELGGIPLDEIGATGFGVTIAAEAAEQAGMIELRNARIAVQGFGSVGTHAARFLAERGAVLVAASDSKGTLIDPDGIDVAKLIAVKKEGGAVSDYASGAKSDVEAIIDVACDIWIPAARPDVIRADNVALLDTKLVIEGANIPVTSEAEAVLHDRGVPVIPDFIANAGGVIAGAVEYRGGTERQAFDMIAEKIEANVKEVIEDFRDRRIAPRQAAEDMARRRVQRAMNYRRWG
ncbi:MAG: Glu/Leu/Phe/Val dehydrogenase [Alphaproteobacteria bacterium]|nr:Glu/Leu/Phe/Val dehydrogenase [Alphaproteobacteria bacterium]